MSGTATSPPRGLVFDLDDTLAASKAAVGDAMAAALATLLEAHAVCVISGGRWEQFQTQLVARLPPSAELTELHLMPTCGAAYLRWRPDGWHHLFADVLSQREVTAAAIAIEQSARALGFWEPTTWGERIENRGAQVTFSALGQQAPLEAKRDWDPDGAKKELLRIRVGELLPDLEVRSGGSTSIDITRRGIDKAFGVRRFLTETGFDTADVTFFGDRLDPGGNDFPVLAVGVECVSVDGPDDTLDKLAPYLNR